MCVFQSVYCTMYIQVPIEVRRVTYYKCEVTDSCYLPEVGSKNRTQVLCKKIQCSLNH